MKNNFVKLLALNLAIILFFSFPASVFAQQNILPLGTTTMDSTSETYQFTPETSGWYSFSVSPGGTLSIDDPAGQPLESFENTNESEDDGFFIKLASNITYTVNCVNESQNRLVSVEAYEYKGNGGYGDYSWCFIPEETGYYRFSGYYYDIYDPINECWLEYNPFGYFMVEGHEYLMFDSYSEIIFFENEFIPLTLDGALKERGLYSFTPTETGIYKITGALFFGEDSYAVSHDKELYYFELEAGETYQFANNSTFYITKEELPLNLELCDTFVNHGDTFSFTPPASGQFEFWASGSELRLFDEEQQLITVSNWNTRIVDLEGNKKYTIEFQGGYMCAIGVLCKHSNFVDLPYEGHEPTCISGGIGETKCLVCDAVLEENVNILPNGRHRAGQIHESQPPSCGNPGAGYTLCIYCEEPVESNIVIPPTGNHTPGQLIADVPATCTDNGLGYKNCTVCGQLAEGNILIPAAGGHTAGALVVDTAATCGTNGVGHKNCTVCGQVAESNIVIPATGSHTGGKWVETTPATYEAEGVTSELCTTCGAVLNTKAIAKLVKATELFKDIKENAYYEDAVSWAVSKEITNGVGNEQFAPEQVCTRGQIVTFLWRANGCPEPQSSVNPFSDVPANAYYTKAVLWAVEQGITNGTGGGKFSPGAECIREQIVTFLWRSQGKPTMGSANPFGDIQPGTYSYDAVLWAVEKGITKGTSATTFAPKDDCTRGQIVTFLYRCLA